MYINVKYFIKNDKHWIFINNIFKDELPKENFKSFVKDSFSLGNSYLAEPIWEKVIKIVASNKDLLIIVYRQDNFLELHIEPKQKQNVSFGAFLRWCNDYTNSFENDINKKSFGLRIKSHSIEFYDSGIDCLLLSKITFFSELMSLASRHGFYIIQLIACGLSFITIKLLNMDINVIYSLIASLIPLIFQAIIVIIWALFTSYLKKENAKNFSINI